MHWQIGDRFVFVRGKPGTNCGGGKHNFLLGSMGTILSLRAMEAEYFTVSADDVAYPQIDRWGGWGVHPSWLRPIPDHRISSWDELEKIIDWNPKVTV